MVTKQLKTLGYIGLCVLIAVLLGYGYYVVQHKSFIPSISSPVADQVVDQVTLDLGERSDDDGRQIYLTVATTKEYNDGNYVLHTNDDFSADKVTIEILDVTHTPGLATQAIAPAKHAVTLGDNIGTIQVDILNQGNTDSYTVTISEGSATLQSNGSVTFSTITQGVVDRFINNELNISCSRYDAIQFDEHCDQFFAALENSGAQLQEDKGNFFRTYWYEGSIDDFTPILDQYDDDDYTLRITSPTTSLLRQTHPCEQILDGRPEALTLEGQTLETFEVQQFKLSMQLPASWYILDRPGDVTIYSDKCGKLQLHAIDLSREEFITSKYPNVSVYMIEQLEIESDRLWEKRISIKAVDKAVGSTDIFTQQGSTMYFFSNVKSDAKLEEIIKQIASQMVFE